MMLILSDEFYFYILQKTKSMRVFNKLFLVGAGLIAIQLVSFENSGAEQIWHKGNLHTELLKI